MNRRMPAAVSGEAVDAMLQYARGASPRHRLRWRTLTVDRAVAIHTRRLRRTQYRLGRTIAEANARVTMGAYDWIDCEIIGQAATLEALRKAQR